MIRAPRRLRRTKRRGTPASLRAVVDDLADVVGWERVGVLAGETTLYASDAGVAARTPGLVVWPESTVEVAAVVRACVRHGMPFTARGAGTGLSGGAVAEPAGVVISLARMNAVLEVNAAERYAWVQPGVVNLELTKAVAGHGLHFAPDPSSQSVCTVGGNVAENSGGPHCLLYGSTSPHVLAVEVVLPTGEVLVLGSPVEETVGYDLRGVFVGSEGMCGIATRICVRLTETRPAVATLLSVFDDVIAACRATSGVIAAGVLPAALELMDGPLCNAVAAFLGTDDYPSDGATALICEVDGTPEAVERNVERVRGVMEEHGARSVRRAADPAERDRIWRGRKSAFGALGRIASHYYLHDCVVPRTRLAEILNGVYEAAKRHNVRCVNVFHAGDGNLHPLLVYDASEPGIRERVDATGEAIVRLCVDAGGTLTGEHGIGLEKRELMGLVFTEDDLDAQAKIPRAFDPAASANRDKVFPRGSRCGDVRVLDRTAADAQATGLWV